MTTPPAPESRDQETDMTEILPVRRDEPERTDHEQPTVPDDAAPGASAPATPTGPRQQHPVYRTGPGPFALVLGIFGLLLAAGIFVIEATEADVPWNDLGPWSVVVAGVVILVVGAIGLRSSRSRG